MNVSKVSAIAFVMVSGSLMGCGSSDVPIGALGHAKQGESTCPQPPADLCRSGEVPTLAGASCEWTCNKATPITCPPVAAPPADFCGASRHPHPRQEGRRMRRLDVHAVGRRMLGGEVRSGVQLQALPSAGKVRSVVHPGRSRLLGRIHSLESEEQSPDEIPILGKDRVARVGNDLELAARDLPREDS